MKIYIASDHAAYGMKKEIIADSVFESIDFVDLGCESEDSVDYPEYAQKLSREVLADKGSLGILLCGSGISMSIKKNRFPGIRAALCFSEDYARLSKEHNNANVLVLGARFLDLEQAKSIIQTWLNTEFAGDRHQRRLDLIDSSVARD